MNHTGGKRLRWDGILLLGISPNPGFCSDSAWHSFTLYAHFLMKCVGSREPEAVDRDIAFTLGYVKGILTTM